MDLGDGCSCQGLGVELAEKFGQRRAELRLDLSDCFFRGEGRDVLLEPLQLVLQPCGYEVRAVAEDLPQLDEGRPQLLHRLADPDPGGKLSGGAPLGALAGPEERTG